MYHSLRRTAPGMQVHAVPESERAYDSTGRKLPWGYEYPNNTSMTDNEPAEPVEKGPFGRSVRRSRMGTSRSRTRTAEPRREEEKIREENRATEEAVFGSLRRVGTRDDAETTAANGSVVGAQIPARVATAEVESEPTEVLLYGFGEDMQWAAIDFYERVSNGYVLEDYERQPPGARYDISRSLGRANAQKSLSRAAMRKKNRYAGGENWIKITFDSQQAAELAIARAPHIIRGYLVYAEPYQGHGPQKDEAVLATQAGAQITSDNLPPTFSTIAPLPDGSPNSSQTLSSATATGNGNANAVAPLRRLPWGRQDQLSSTASSSTVGAAPPEPPAARQQVVPTPAASLARAPSIRSSLISGARRAELKPAEMALAPKAAKPSWSSWIGASEVIGSAVPRKEDGTFDWDRASFYWRLFWYIDFFLGSDLCGLKGED